MATGQKIGFRAAGGKGGFAATGRKAGFGLGVPVVLALLLALGSFAWATAPDNGTAATIEISGPSDGYSTQSRNIQFNFIYHKNDDVYNKPHCVLLINNSQMDSNDFTAGVAASFSENGLYRTKYDWQIACGDTTSDVRRLTILPLDPPTLSLNAPADQSATTSSVVDFYYTYNSGSDEIPSTNCSLIVGPFIQGRGVGVSGQQSVIVSDPLQPVVYSWFITCERPNGNPPLKTSPRIIKVLPPPVNVSAPPNITNAANASANRTAVNNTFVNQQVVLDAPAYAQVARRVVVTVRTLDHQPLPGAVVLVYTAQGTKLTLEPTDAQGQTAFIPSTLGLHTYSVESLLLVQKIDTLVTRTGGPDSNQTAGGAPANNSAGAGAGTNANKTGGAAGAQANGSLGAGAGTNSNAAAGVVGALAGLLGGANNSSANANSNAGIPWVPILAGAGIVVILGVGAVLIFKKKANDEMPP